MGGAGRGAGAGAGQAAMPLLEAALEYAASRPVRLHVPGHKGGPGLPPAMRRALGARAAALDATEVAGLDDLHLPSGPIARAQELAAAAFGADRTFFLVNGSTCGVLAMIGATCGPGDDIVMPRHAHPSAVAGCILAGARPVWVPVAADGATGVPLGPAPEAVRAALAGCRRPAAVLVVHPNYYGVAADVAAVVAAARGFGAAVLADEAHGAHFAFHPALPPAALAAGADASVQGLHKTGGALTGAAMLHLRGERVDARRLAAFLKLVETASPSYLLLCSLDAARAHLHAAGPAAIERCLVLAGRARRDIEGTGRFSCPGRELAAMPGAAGHDPTRLVVHARGVPGAAPGLAARLRSRLGVEVEMAAGSNIVAVLTWGDRPAGLRRLVRGLRVAGAGGWVTSNESHAAAERAALDLMSSVPEQVLPPRDAVYAPWREVALEKAVGATSAELAAVHPPGFLVLIPGERIGERLVAALAAMRRGGARFQGAADPLLATVRVVAS